ncbi:MAG: glycosyltransferase family 39 protein [Chitinophagales bacterium]
MFNYLQLFRIDRWIPILFFVALLITGIFIYGDYGLCWDDPMQHKLGLVAWDYVSGKSNDLFGNENCYINPLVMMVEVLPEKILQPATEAEAFLLKHLANFILCWLGLIIFYLLGLRLFRDYRFALIACLLLILTPRLLAHFFYNSKDLPFLFLFVLSMYVLVTWIQKPSWSRIGWLAVCSGILTATRVVGVLFPVIIFIVVIVAMLARKLSRKELRMIMVYFLLYPFTVYVFFPSIWEHPFEKFFAAIALYTHHPYDVTTLFMGETVHSLETPWYYVPVWMLIIIPIGWWLLFLGGMVALIKRLILERMKFSLLWLSVLLWLFLPLSAVVLLRGSTYEDARHFFFIQPALLLISTAGMQWLLRTNSSSKIFWKSPASLIALTVFIVTTSYLLLFNFKYHPFQHSYFNAIGRKYAQDSFDKDYWGVSYKNALEFLVKYEQKDSMKVRWKIDPCEWNLVWLSERDRNRIHFVKYDQCEYYITNYRSHTPFDAVGEKIYEERVQGFTIVAVYKMHPPNDIPVSTP